MQLLAEGREAEVFLRPDGHVLKLWRSAGDDDRVGREAAALDTLRSAGVAAPVVVSRTTVDGRPGLVVSRIEGRDLLSELSRRPLGVVATGRAMASAHLAMHACVAPASLPSLHETLRERIGAAEPLSAAQRTDVLALLDDLPGGDRLCHGDLHPGNMLGSRRAPVVIDWGDAARGDPIADVARTSVIHRFGRPLPGTLGLVARLLGVGRRILRSTYLATYRRTTPLDDDLFARWELLCAAARLAEPVPDEHPDLLAFLATAFE